MEGTKRILEVHALSTSWRNTFEKRMRGEEMNTKERLEGKNNKNIFINGAFLLVKRIRKRYFYIINLLIFKNLNIFLFDLFSNSRNIKLIRLFLYFMIVY